MNEPRFEIYPTMFDEPEGEAPAEATGEYGWRFRAANGQIAAVGGEAFTRREDARRAVKDFLASAMALEPHAGDDSESIIDTDA